jgi:hypothetical protein
MQLSNPPILINALCNLLALIIISNCSHAFFFSLYQTFLCGFFFSIKFFKLFLLKNGKLQKKKEWKCIAVSNSENAEVLEMEQETDVSSQKIVVENKIESRHN